MYRDGRRIQSSILLGSSHIILFHCMCTDATIQHIYYLPEDIFYSPLSHFFEIIMLKSNHTELFSTARAYKEESNTINFDL